MIARNEINVQGKSANKTDNRTILDKPCKGRIFAQNK